MANDDPTQVAPEPATTDARLTALERTVSELRREVAALRTEREPDRPRETAQGHEPAPAQDARDTFRRELTRFDRRSAGRDPGRRTVSVDAASIESFIGRYGTLILATITALAAVGTFLGWAIAHGLLGPRMRLGLGFAAAVAIGIAGFRMRARERSFGSSLIGLALAIVHVCAWGAGPSLHVIPVSVAFVVAATMSAALAVFAQAEGDEPLWCVGFVGAAAAPFVVSGGQGNASLLAAYAAVLLMGAAYALGSRPWRVAGQLFVLGATVFTGALAALPERELGPVYALALPLVVAIAGVLPFTEGEHRRTRTRALGALAALSALRLGLTTTLPFGTAGLAGMIAAAAIAWLAIVDRFDDASEGSSDASAREAAVSAAWVEGALLPLAFLAAVLTALDGAWRPSAVAAAIAAIVLMAFSARRERTMRDAGALSTAIALGVLGVCATEADPFRLAFALSGVGVMIASADLVAPSVSWRWTSVLSLAAATVLGLAQLQQRTWYAYTPFGTMESVAAAVPVLAWAAVIALSRNGDERLRRAAWAGGAVALFFWVHGEIQHAFSATTSTVLRISYYAATSALAVGIGRARKLSVVRHVGLLLALVAAGTALRQAHGLASVGARVAAYLVVSAFLMGIAYWYRAGAPSLADAATPDDSAGGAPAEA